MPSEISSSTQKFTDVFDITNNMVILNDGSVSQIIEVGTINFGLLSEEEQDAAIYAYAGILNSLTFPIQIVIRSQSKDITNYLNSLVEAENNSTNPSHKAQIARYREFVRTWVKTSNILDKDFFVVITASALDLGIGTAKNVFNTTASVNLDRYELAPIIEKASNILNPMRDHLISQFGRIGLYAHQIDTQQIIKIFYQSYNPNDADGIGIMESQDFSAPIISANIVESKLEQT
ncbi:hypothetical protein IJJ27_01090 [bacterium]|nr:hypothetical protein [bacterium]MBQ6436140.1 hypothetical protein [bacterium]